MTLDEQIRLALAALPKERKRFIVVPKRPKSKGGGKRRKAPKPSIIVLKRGGSDPWYIWRAENALLRIVIQRVNFSELGYAWEVVNAVGVPVYHGTSSFAGSLESINRILEREGYRWRVKATPLRGGGKRGG